MLGQKGGRNLGRAHPFVVVPPVLWLYAEPLPVSLPVRFSFEGVALSLDVLDLRWRSAVVGVWRQRVGGSLHRADDPVFRLVPLRG